MNRRTYVVSCVSVTVGLRSRAVIAAAAPAFRSARPIWPMGRTTEMNLLAGFRATVALPVKGRVL